MWHRQYGQEKKADDALRSMPFYEAVHRLAHLIIHVDMVCEAKAVVEAVVARLAKPGHKANPLDAGKGLKRMK